MMKFSTALKSGGRRGRYSAAGRLHDQAGGDRRAAAGVRRQSSSAQVDHRAGQRRRSARQCRRHRPFRLRQVRSSRDNDKATLQQQATWLQKYPRVRVTVEGHCDERGTREYNLALGARRANAVKEYLVSLGVSAARVDTISYGKERPICTESKEDCWAQNRRGVTTITRRRFVLIACRSMNCERALLTGALSVRALSGPHFRLSVRIA